MKQVGRAVSALCNLGLSNTKVDHLLHQHTLPVVLDTGIQGNQFTQLITDAVPALIAYVGTDERYLFANKAYETWCGRADSTIVGMRLDEALGARYAVMRPYVAEVLRTGRQVSYDATSDSAADGRREQVLLTPDLDPAGGVRGFSIMMVDGPDRPSAEQALAGREQRLRAMEERLQRHEREFRTLVEGSPDIISRIDREMRHIYVNPAIQALAPLPAAAWLGKTKAELGLPPAVVEAWDKAARAAFDTGLEQKLEFDHCVDGRMRYFSGRIIPDIDGSGHADSVVGIAYDVTERALIEKERDDWLARERTARIQAETAARARDEFLAIVSHELRAPLNGIQSWAHVLENYVKDSTSAPLAQRALQGIKTGVGQQVRLIEDLLDVTRMMSGKLRLVRQPLALLPVIQAAVESVRSIAAAKRIGITCTYRITSEQIDGDSDRVQQIFWNLLSNAVKFTPDGGNVWLTVSHTDKEILVMVRDDGVGVSPEFLPHLFNRFSQEDTSSTRDHSGLGLGLFLVRHLIELHHGSVSAESEGEGKGTTFTVRLPMREPTEKYIPALRYGEPGEDSMPLPSLKGLRILLIDDQAEARESLTVVLTNAGGKVFASDSANEVVAWLQGLRSDEYPDVLVCDIAMPGEDGYTVLRRLRNWKAEGSAMPPLQRMPALALTAFAQREDRIRALTAGFQMHVTKPVAPEELIVVIDTMVARRN
jgi:PAS domain S-box-containing protein